MTELEPQPTIKGAQIVVIALVLGQTFFAGIVLMVLNNKPNPGGNEHLLYLGIGGAATCILAWFTCPLLISKMVREKVTDKTWSELNKGEQFNQTMGLYTGLIVIRGAVIQGANFLNMVLCIASANRTFWAVIGVLFLFMLFTFPTQLKYETWVSSETEKIQLS